MLTQRGGNTVPAAEVIHDRHGGIVYIMTDVLETLCDDEIKENCRKMMKKAAEISEKSAVLSLKRSIVYYE